MLNTVFRLQISELPPKSCSRILPASLPIASLSNPTEVQHRPDFDLIPKSLKIQFFKALLDSNASEHGARMTAMHKATDNATEIVGDLKLVYNRLRQDAITNEILEIVSGANALKGK